MQQRILFEKSHQAQLGMQIEQSVKLKGQFLPWVEKYRPDKIDDVCHQEEVIQSLKGVLKTGSLPHLLLYGPPGTGKTSVILALARQLFGPEFWRKRVLELNASDDRGINVVRKKIKNFAEQLAAKNPNNQYICPPYKIIILDEADSITREAQDALRRIIEDFSGTTRFCIICNYITKISEPLASRCVKYRFRGIPKIQQMERLTKISQNENVLIDEDVSDIFLKIYLQNNDKSIKKLFEISGGDLRRSINLLQSTSILGQRKITQDLLFQVSGFVPDIYINDTIGLLKTNNLPGIILQQKQIIKDGFNIEQFLSQLSSQIMSDTYVPELYKAKCLEYAAVTERQLKEGASPDLCLLNFLTQSQRAINGY